MADKDLIATDKIQYDNPINNVVARRIALCRQCPRLIKVVNLCSACGCYAPFKVRLMTSQCPIGKWFAYDGTRPVDKDLNLLIDEKPMQPGGSVIYRHPHEKDSPFK